MATLLRATLICALGLAAAFLVACGDRNGLLPSDRAQSLNGALDQLDSALASGDCAAAERAVSSLNAAAGSLSSPQVNRTLISNINQGAHTIAALTPKSCQTTPTTTTPTNTTTTQTQTQTTQTQTQSTPTQTQPTTPTQTQPQTNPGNNGGATVPNTGGGGPPGQLKKAKQLRGHHHGHGKGDGGD
jgi:hypothetical protein